MLLFRGRLRPNIQRDPSQPLEVRFIRPNWAREQITLKIKELDTYRDPQNRQISEGSQDDLLATFTGRILRSAPRRFQVESHTNAETDTSLPTIKIKFQGSETVYDIPVVSEEGESEGTNWEIAFTVEYPGQDDYNSPVSFIARSLGKILIVDNTTSDLSAYESHANLIRHYFTSRGMQGKIIRGAKSNTSTAHYAAMDTDHYYGGYDLSVFTNVARNYDYIYFNCHGYVDLVDAIGIGQGDPCNLCVHQYSDNSLRACRRTRSSTSAAQKCDTVDRRGFFFYTPRSGANVNQDIDLPLPMGTWMQVEFPDRLIRRFVGPFVDWDEYGPAFFSANDNNPTTAGIQNPNITTNPATPTTIAGVPVPGDVTYNLEFPRRYKFPTLAAFPSSGLRPNFFTDNLQTVGGAQVQNPASAYLHHSSAQAVPGVPSIHFMGRGGPLSAEVSARPTAGAATPTFTAGGAAPTAFSTAPTGLQATAGNRRVVLTWNRVRDAVKYVLYWSTSPGIRASSVNTAAHLNINAVHGIQEGPIPGQFSASVSATPAATAGTPAVPAAGAATPFAGGVTGVTATPGSGQVLVSWNPVQGADSYRVQSTITAGFSGSDIRLYRNIKGTHFRDTGLMDGTTFYYRVQAVADVVGYNHTGLTNGTTYHYRVRAIGDNGDLCPGDWTSAGDLSNVKVVYAGCCLTGRKTVFADAVLSAGAKFFIGHQVVTGGVSEGLINRFWRRWLNRGAILRNLINIYNEVLQTNASYRRTRPVIYYRNSADQTRFWRFGMAIPTDIKTD